MMENSLGVPLLELLFLNDGMNCILLGNKERTLLNGKTT
jgi:hypothetical protein